jgi:hypothetical protein
MVSAILKIGHSPSYISHTGISSLLMEFWSSPNSAGKSQSTSPVPDFGLHFIKVVEVAAKEF